MLMTHGLDVAFSEHGDYTALAAVLRYVLHPRGAKPQYMVAGLMRFPRGTRAPEAIEQLG